MDAASSSTSPRTATTCRSSRPFTRLADLGLADIVANIDGYSDARKTLAARVSAAMEDT